MHTSGGALDSFLEVHETPLCATSQEQLQTFQRCPDAFEIATQLRDALFPWERRIQAFELPEQVEHGVVGKGADTVLHSLDLLLQLGH